MAWLLVSSRCILSTACICHSSAWNDVVGVIATYHLVVMSVTEFIVLFSMFLADVSSCCCALMKSTIHGFKFRRSRWWLNSRRFTSVLCTMQQWRKGVGLWVIPMEVSWRADSSPGTLEATMDRGLASQSLRYNLRTVNSLMIHYPMHPDFSSIRESGLLMMGLLSRQKYDSLWGPWRQAGRLKIDLY